MMPDLGAYATEITLAYVTSLAMLAGLILWVWARGHRVKQSLIALETRLNRTTQ